MNTNCGFATKMCGKACLSVSPPKMARGSAANWGHSPDLKFEALGKACLSANPMSVALMEIFAS